MTIPILSLRNKIVLFLSLRDKAQNFGSIFICLSPFPFSPSPSYFFCGFCDCLLWLYCLVIVLRLSCDCLVVVLSCGCLATNSNNKTTTLLERRRDNHKTRQSQDKTTVTRQGNHKIRQPQDNTTTRQDNHNTRHSHKTRQPNDKTITKQCRTRNLSVYTQLHS